MASVLRLHSGRIAVALRTLRLAEALPDADGAPNVGTDSAAFALEVPAGWGASSATELRCSSDAYGLRVWRGVVSERPPRPTAMSTILHTLRWEQA